MPETPLAKPRTKTKQVNAPKFDVRAMLYQLTGIDLTLIHGIGSSVALSLIAECGTDLSRWPTEKHFTSWLCLSPGCKISGGKVLSSHTRKSNSRVASQLRLVASTVGRTETALGAFYRRLAARIGIQAQISTSSAIASVSSSNCSVAPPTSASRCSRSRRVFLRKDQGIGLHLLTNREKTQLVDALRQTYSTAELLSSVALARSSYFYHRSRLKAAEKYAEVRRTITDIFERNHCCYGYRRIQASLVRQCVCISEKVVRRLMKQESLVAAVPRRRRYGSYMGEIGPAPENLIQRDFSATAPNQKWLTDISEFQLPEGKVYLSPMIDCFDGMVVSWSISTRPDAELVNTMLDAAIASVQGGQARPVVHSDRGAHYRWPGWLTRIADAKLVRSMSRKGYSPDNAACEGFFGRLKTEWFYARDWRATTIEQFTQALDAYIRWYNEQRIKMSLGARSPVEYRRAFGIAA